jgi:predicted nucleotidyltransferase
MPWNWSDYRGNLDWLQARTIFLTRHGSHAYGTNIAGSDEDFKGICISPIRYYLGIKDKFEQADKGFGDTDASIYDIKKFFELAAKCNPNIIEVLFTDDSDWVFPTSIDRMHKESPFFNDLRYNRDLFISKLARHTFSGYAMAQLKRIKTHRRWLLNQPTHVPTRKEFGLPDAPTIDRDQLNAVISECEKIEDRLGGEGFTKDRVEDVSDETVAKVAAKHELGANIIEVIQKERRFRNSMASWKQFLEWKDGRNAKRSELEAKYGYDTKHAMHLVRLMRMATEILDGKGVIVKRPDAQELLSIRNGSWTYDDLMSWAYAMDGALNVSYQNSKLPHGPDRDKIDDLLVNIIDEFRGANDE